MKKFAKGKVGFTLIEMVLVIALIVILASFFVFAYTSFLNKANTAKETVEAHNSVLTSMNSGIDAAA